MEPTIFLFTIVVMLICTAAAASCLSAFVITRNKVMLFLAFAFLLYFFDLSSIFQNEYLNLHTSNLEGEAFYDIRNPYLKIATSAGILECLWLTLLEYLNKRGTALMIVPCAVFLIVAIVIVEVMSPGKVKQWCFYSITEAFLVWMFIYIIYQRLHAHSDLQKSKLNRLMPLVIAVAFFTVCIVVENTIVIMVWEPAPEDSQSALLFLLSERNISENFLILVIALFALHTCFKTLRLHRKTNTGEPEQQNAAYIRASLDAMSEKYNLTKREREVLEYAISGKDYKNIASSLQLALGTVKSHMHNIFRKTGVKSTAELIELFWSN